MDLSYVIIKYMHTLFHSLLSCIFFSLFSLFFADNLDQNLYYLRRKRETNRFISIEDRSKVDKRDIDKMREIDRKLSDKKTVLLLGDVLLIYCLVTVYAFSQIFPTIIK